MTTMDEIRRIFELHRRIEDEVREMRRNPPTIVVHASQEAEIRAAVDQIVAEDPDAIRPIIKGSEWAVEPNHAIVFQGMKFEFKGVL